MKLVMLLIHSRVGVLIPSKVAGNPSNRVKSPSNSETSKWERSQQLVPSKVAGKLVLVLGAKWERLGVKILVVPSKAAGNQLGTTWKQENPVVPSKAAGNQPGDGKSGPPQARTFLLIFM